jgi:large subunit ribosomal protein L25
MEVGKLTVSVRTGHGKNAARQLRIKGLVPGVCYGSSVAGRIEPFPVSVNVKALRAALDPVRKQNTVIDLTVEGGPAPRMFTALVKDYQIDIIRRDITHVDFIAIDPNKEVIADVPLEFIGKHKGTIAGGQLRIVLRTLSLKAKPADIPLKITVDVSPLDIGDVIHVSDLTLPEGALSVTGRDLAVITCVAPEEDKTPVAAEAAAPAADAKAADAKAPAKDAKGGAAKGAAPAKDAKGGAAKGAAPAAKAAPAKPAKPAKK